MQKLEQNLSSEDIAVKFHSARCMLAVGDDRALGILRGFALDENSAYRIEAIEAVGSFAKRNDALNLMNRLVAEDDFGVKFTAYSYIRKLGDITHSKSVVGDNFYLEKIHLGKKKIIYVARKDEPKIVIFGSPVYCEKNIYIESDDGSVIITTAENDDFLSVMRKHPKRQALVGPLKSGRELCELIEALGQSPVGDPKSRKRAGLGIGYDQILEIIEKMCQRGAINADFVMSEPSEAINIP